VFVSAVFGRDLFEAIIAKDGKDGWNAYSESLAQHKLWECGRVPDDPVTGKGLEDFLPIVVNLDLSGQDFRHADLSGLNLFFATVERADFSGANLARSTIGQPIEAVFRNADLRNATIIGDLSGTDFTDAHLEGALFDQVSCDRFRRPRGLPEQYLSQCRHCPSAEYYRPKSVIEKELARPLLKVHAQLRFYWH
jgi:hypothetical protein